MATEDQAEKRLRQLLRDDRWSLPSWPDTEARVSRAARRQRVTAALAGATVAAAIAAAIVAPLTLTSTAPPVTGSASATPHRHYSLPPVGARGFPAAIYPAPRPHPVVDPIRNCPASEGLQSFTAGDAAAARALIPKLGRSFQKDLRLTDRVFWPVVLIGWQRPHGHARVDRRPILYSGPLESYHQSEGPPDYTRRISASCGARLAAETWMIVDGPRASPALQNEWLFLTRRGHVLLYYNQ